MLADPVTTIFNASLSSSVVPRIWKESNIIPIPKVQQPECEGDTRPISLTSSLSKLLEDFVVSWLIDDVKGKIDPCQFYCLKGTSTTYCLLDMLHSLLSHLDSDSNGRHIRISFLEFSKAFDRIGYNILIEKLLDLSVRRSLIPWIINFLCDRRQRVKIGETFSSWLPVTAGVPQGTKLGPILFLIMINDLRVNSPGTKMWKFVDDVSSSENLTSNSFSVTQSTLDSIDSWATYNCMKLNAKKCKELRVSFLKETLQLPSLTIDGHVVETVQSHKVLGLIFKTILNGTSKFDQSSPRPPNGYTVSGYYAAVVSLLLILPTYTSRLFVLFWNTVVRYGITRYLAICLTNWKEYKSVPCALSFLATHTTKLSNWLIAQDLATGETKPV